MTNQISEQNEKKGNYNSGSNVALYTISDCNLKPRVRYFLKDSDFPVLKASVVEIAL